MKIDYLFKPQQKKKIKKLENWKIVLKPVLAEAKSNSKNVQTFLFDFNLIFSRYLSQTYFWVAPRACTEQICLTVWIARD